jgi:hypothetical protein
MYAQLRKAVVEAKVALMLPFPQAYPLMSHENVSVPVSGLDDAVWQAGHTQAQCFCAGQQHYCGL